MYLQENEPLTKKLLLQNQVFNIPVIKKTLIFAGHQNCKHCREISHRKINIKPVLTNINIYISKLDFENFSTVTIL